MPTLTTLTHQQSPIDAEVRDTDLSSLSNLNNDSGLVFILSATTTQGVCSIVLQHAFSPQLLTSSDNTHSQGSVSLKVMGGSNQRSLECIVDAQACERKPRFIDLYIILEIWITRTARDHQKSLSYEKFELRVMLPLCFSHVDTVATRFLSSVLHYLGKLSKTCAIFFSCEKKS